MSLVVIVSLFFYTFHHIYFFAEKKASLIFFYKKVDQSIKLTLKAVILLLIITINKDYLRNIAKARPSSYKSTCFKTYLELLGNGIY